MHFTAKIGSGPGKQSQLEDAWRNDIPVDGTVVKEMKGGFEIKIAGSVRAFCPFSQMGLRRGDPQAEYIGRSLPFKIIEYAENGRNIVVSRKPILEKERREKVAALKATLQEGMKMNGTVTSIQNFGAFVDIGGIEGLLPISEIAWTRTEKVSDILSVGQTVEVIIKKLDWEQNRFSFSLKDAMPDPWERVEDAFQIGSYPFRDGFPSCSLRRVRDPERRRGRAHPYLETRRRQENQPSAGGSQGRPGRRGEGRGR